MTRRSSLKVLCLLIEAFEFPFFFPALRLCETFAPRSRAASCTVIRSSRRALETVAAGSRVSLGFEEAFRFPKPPHFLEFLPPPLSLAALRGFLLFPINVAR